jgi:hypothetical protein
MAIKVFIANITNFRLVPATYRSNSEAKHYSCTPEDDPGKVSKHVAIPPTTNKNKCSHSSVYFVPFLLFVVRLSQNYIYSLSIMS